jgi:hypothetical protein
VTCPVAQIELYRWPGPRPSGAQSYRPCREPSATARWCAVRSDDDICLRLLHQQIRNINKAAEGREQFQIHLQQVGAKQRRGFRRLQTVEHEIVDLRAQMRPIEIERAEFGASPCPRLHRGDNLFPHHAAKPIGAYDRDAGHEQNQNQ